MIKSMWYRGKSLVYIKVGIFFIAAFFLIFFTLLSMKEFSFFEGHYIITVKFDFAEGIRPSSPVRFCGVDVGEVKKVVVKGPGDQRPSVYVDARIHKGIKIPKNSYFFINSLSLFGEKYLEINPADSIEGEYLADGQIIEGTSPIPLFNVFATFTKTMKEIHEFVKEGKIKTSLENTLTNVEDMSLSLKELIEDMKNKKGTIGRFLYDDSLYKVTEEFIADLKEHPWKLLYKPKERKRR